MLKATLKTLAVLFLFSAILTSCKKKNDQKSKTTLLTQKEWFVEKLEEKMNNGQWVDDVPNWPACDKDDKLIFRTNNTFEENEGATKCSAGDNQIIGTGAWAFVDNETKITFYGDTLTITQLDENTMILSITETFGADTYYTKITLRH